VAHYEQRTPMSQQINILNSLPKPPRFQLSEKIIFLVLGSYLAFLLMLTLAQSALLGWNKYTLVQLQKSYDQQQLELNKNTKMAEANSTLQLETQLSEKKALLQSLESRKSSAGQCAFLSYYFEILSQSVLPGLWLTKINIDLNTEVMSLSGNTYLSTLPFSFIQTLQKTPCFVDKQVGSIELTRPTTPILSGENAGKLDKKDNVVLGFTLKSSPESGA
jgi:hypothetical protein